jgi:hypothetical protein
MNPVPLYMETDRKLTFTECRTRRSQEITFWEMLRDQPVSVLCIKADYKEE